MKYFMSLFKKKVKERPSIVNMLVKDIRAMLEF